MKLSQLRQLIREEVKNTNKNNAAKEGTAKKGTYTIQYITDDIGNKIYTVFLDGKQFGDMYSGSGTIPSGPNTPTPTDVLRKLLGKDYN